MCHSLLLSSLRLVGSGNTEIQIQRAPCHARKRPEVQLSKLSGKKKQPKGEDSRPDIPRTSGGHSRGYPGSKLWSGPSKPWKKKYFGADIHDPQARTSTTLRDFQKFRSENFGLNFHSMNESLKVWALTVSQNPGREIQCIEISKSIQRALEVGKRVGRKRLQRTPQPVEVLDRLLSGRFESRLSSFPAQPKADQIRPLSFGGFQMVLPGACFHSTVPPHPPAFCNPISRAQNSERNTHVPYKSVFPDLPVVNQFGCVLIVNQLACVLKRSQTD